MLGLTTPNRHAAALSILALAALNAAFLAGGNHAVAGTATGLTTRLSVSSSGTQSNGLNLTTSMSPNGRFVVFDSTASNLVRGDTNNRSDVFVRDQVTGTTRRVSLSSGGTQGNDDSAWGAISASGRFVAFFSFASNLVRGDTNGAGDVFVRDLVSGTTRRASVSSGERQADDRSYFPLAISADGKFVAFASSASNLVPADTNGKHGDVFVRNLIAGTTEVVSVSSREMQGNLGSDSGMAISAHGEYVAFRSDASNLVPGDTNGLDLFVRNRIAGTTERVSVSSTGEESPGAPSIIGVAMSASGRFVAFSSDATNLVPDDTNGFSDVFVRDRAAKTTDRVSVTSDEVQSNSGGGSYEPSLSPDGRFVAFASNGSDLVPGDTNGVDNGFNGQDVFLRDRAAGTTRRVSVSTTGSQADAGTTAAGYRNPVSAAGKYVAFSSASTNLVADDTNSADDVFVRLTAP